MNRWDNDFQSEIALQRRIEECYWDATQIDVVFLVGVTPSMEGSIQAIENQVDAMVNEWSGLFGSRVRLAFVGYRDYDDGMVEFLDFTSNVEEFKDFLTCVDAYGGGDDAEDVFSGLNALLDLDWSPGNTAKTIFHIADCPCHGPGFYGAGFDDDDLEDDIWQRDVRNTLLSLKEDVGVRSYVFSHLYSSTEPMISEFKDVIQDGQNDNAWIQGN